MTNPSQKRPRIEPYREEADVDNLRKVSRQAYLERREAQQRQKLRDEILDEKTLFREDELTKTEKEALAFKEEVYRLAVERSAAAHESGEAYHIPDEAGVREDESKEKTEGAYSRYVKPEAPTSDQAVWEADQIRKGGGRGDTTRTTHTQDYELVLEEVDFLQAESLPALRHVSTETGPLVPRLPKTSAKDARAEKLYSIQADRRSLPIFTHRSALMTAVRKNQVLIVQSETGSGKSTQLPQFLLEEGLGPIVCTQPRRVAAMSVAARVADEMGVRLGSEIGYSIRFEDCTSEKTRIKYVTDGMLLREFLSEPDLKSYKCIIIDEAHERSLSTDIVMGLVKDIARFRGDDVRVIISSATMDTRKFSVYFDGAPIFTVPGRRYNVDIFYTKSPEPDYIEACCVTILQIHASQPKGDVLVFLSGQDEIELAEDMLRERTRGLGSKMREIVVAPIYSTLPSEMQAKIFETTPDGARKVVLATNIAETSVTIPGIVYVIDPGFCKQKEYNSKTGIESLLVVPVSRAGAKQRAGRAGRMQPGKCFRLFTKWSYENEMEEDSPPELLRTNLSQVVLLLMSLGIENLLEFDFLDPPPPQALLRSLEHLYALGALNEEGQLTKLGRRMAELPLEPMMAKALLTSESYNCTEEVKTICAMLSVNNTIFYRPKEKKVVADAARSAFSRGGGGDHMALLRCYTQWRDSGYSNQWCFENFVQAKSMKRARDVYEQLDSLMDRVEIKRSTVGVGDKVPTLKALTAGFFYNACRLQKNGNYRTMQNPHTVQIHPSSCLSRSELRPRWLVYHELVFTTKEFMRQVFDIDSQWLFDVAPHFYKRQDVEDTSKQKMPKAIGKSGGRLK